MHVHLPRAPSCVRLALRAGGCVVTQDLKCCHQLPVELELGDEFVFHTIFACPVSR